MLMKVSGIVRIFTKESKFLPNGTMLLKLNTVSSKKYKTQSGEQKEDTTWIECISFGKQAEVIDKFFNEKDRIYITGSLKQDNWVDNNGNKRSRHTITIDEFEFVEKSNNQQEYNPNQQQQPNNGQANHNQNPPVQYERQNTVPDIDVDSDEIPFN